MKVFYLIILFSTKLVDLQRSNHEFFQFILETFFQNLLIISFKHWMWVSSKIVSSLEQSFMQLLAKILKVLMLIKVNVGITFHFLYLKLYQLYVITHKTPDILNLVHLLI